MNLKLIPDEPGFAVSDDGRVWSCWQNTRGPGGGKRHKKNWVKGDEWREVEPHLCSLDDYFSVTLYTGNVRIHRLVLTVFVGPCPEGKEACHRNSDKHDNRIENLYWGTRRENMLDSPESAFGSESKPAATRGNAALSPRDVRTIRRRYDDGETVKQIHTDYWFLTLECVSNAARRKSWKHIED